MPAHKSTQMRVDRASAPDVDAVNNYLNRLTGRSRSEQLLDPSPRRVAALLEVLGNPHRDFAAVHLTGTNGKGSTATMTAALLTEEGLRVGLFTSPHLGCVTERIVVDGRRVGDDEFGDAVARVASAADAVGIAPGWFEVVTAAAFWLFSARAVDVAVVEVGMLGAFDATNVLNAGTVVVTNVALDHEQEAGGGLREIADAKAGIIAPGSTLILGESDPTLRPIFEARRPGRVLTRGRELRWTNRCPSAQGSLVDLETPLGLSAAVRIGMIGAHQCDNAILALAAAEAVLDRRLSPSAVSTALEATRVNGRFEIKREHPLVVLDGAHNAAAAVALRRAVSEISAGMTPRILVYGQSRGRDPFIFLRECGVEHVDLIVVTEVAPDATVGEDDIQAARQFGAQVVSVKEPVEALAHAADIAGTQGLVVATGSLRLVGRLRQMALDSPAAAK
jgi:dihydrofolate synthase / folylpolyglutamate synthase